jgi:hypothetical protein
MLIYCDVWKYAVADYRKIQRAQAITSSGYAGVNRQFKLIGANRNEPGSFVSGVMSEAAGLFSNSAERGVGFSNSHATSPFTRRGLGQSALHWQFEN